MTLDISVGEVSGLIATGVFVLQLLIPLAFPYLLAAYVTKKNSVVTWSVLGRFLHTSLWPSILQTDTAASHGVQRRVASVGLLQMLALALISVASIVTPLGLYDTILPMGNGQYEDFQYLKDSSPFGLGTPSRSTAPFTRSCGQNACPGTTKNETCHQVGLAQVCNGTRFDRSIPEVLTSLFRDGATSFSSTVSSIFDVQWRSHYNMTDPFGALGWGLMSTYRQITTLILDEEMHVVEGLIVNTKTGGIGFRNHTVPKKTYPYGSTWTEDLLFIQPETQCVDMNFTFNFHLETVDNSVQLSASGIYIKDGGGFSNLSRKAPVQSMSVPASYNGQGDIDLRSRAYNAAWLTNYLTMLYYNLTNPDINNITRLDAKPGMELHTGLKSEGVNSTFSIQYQSIRSTWNYGEYLNFSKSATDTNHNPFNVSADHFSKIVARCNGALLSDPANLNSSLVGCGIVYGAAKRTDGGDSLVPDPGSKWELPVFTCASSISASIRTVTFKYNGTDLSALQVVHDEPKRYTSPSDRPLWAVENMEWPMYNIGNDQPLWGVIGPVNATVNAAINGNVTTVVQERLRLPGLINDDTLLLTTDNYIPYVVGQNLPGVNFYAQALRGALTISKPSGISYGDYSGLTDFALYAKWQRLSANATAASNIINLVWTDIAANAVVGTKGWGLTSAAANLEKRAEAAGSKDNLVLVTGYGKQVQYKMPFAVPAFVVLGVALAVLLAVVILTCTKKTGIAQLRYLINATSAGRNIGLLLWPDESVGLEKTRDWVKSIGTRSAMATGSTFTVEEVNEGSEKDDEQHASTNKEPRISQAATTASPTCATDAS